MAGSIRDEGEALSQINVTPLVDVLLVLLLVLMVSASAAVARSLDVNLPSAASGAAASSTLTLRIDASGRTWLGEQELSADALGQHVRGLGDPRALSVVLAADGAVAHRHVIGVLDVLRREQVSKLAFAVSAPQAP